MKCKQVNIELNPEQIKRIKHDAVEHNVSLKRWTGVAFEHFLKLTLPQRRNRFAAAECKKTVGAKLQEL